MPTTYTIELDEGPTDLHILDGAKYNFALAKAVESAGKTNTNVIFLSSTDTAEQHVTDHNTLTWTENYALNYSFTVPGEGATVQGVGNWQPVNLGDYYSIDQYGAWAATSGPESTALNVVNNFQEVNIIVAIQTGTDKDPVYNPIFIDQSALLFGASGSYTPLENIELWWGENQVTSTMVESQRAKTEQYTLDGPTKVYFWYEAKTAIWRNQTTGPFYPP
ncbi:hypothetical protein IQ07DRAFT_634724 [Pyrenochaeta sp. DS3sAY3a]|nr:hypothetical protein IQ07DRAFT_634724 [Pyrenochaeta sp. DS3sAY3a]